MINKLHKKGRVRDDLWHCGISAYVVEQVCTEKNEWQLICAQWRYESRVKMAGGRCNTPETDGLGVDGLLHLDLSVLYVLGVPEELFDN